MNNEPGDLFTRDGHLSMLSLDRYDAGELDGVARHTVAHHVDACSRCQARLAEVLSPVVALRPRAAVGRDAGVATVSYLVATAVASVAAALVLWAGGPIGGLETQTAVHTASEPALSAGAYTSVAHEYNEPTAVDLSIDAGANGFVATPAVDGWLAIVELGGAEGDDTAPVVRDVLIAPRVVDAGSPTSLARRGEPVVVLLCAAPPEIAAGARFEPGDDCVFRVVRQIHPR